MQSGSLQREYFPGLDGLRAIAVSFVVFAHFTPRPNLAFTLFPFPYGKSGVFLFFVLSGFLITDILLRVRLSLEAGEISIGGALIVFHARRALRIWPIYFLAIFLVAFVLGDPGLTPGFVWWATFTMNYGIYYLDIPYGDASHIWTLCLEEQFYLLAPLLVLFLRPRLVIALAGAALVAVPAFKAYVAYGISPSYFREDVTLTGSSEGLLLGVMLAYVRNALTADAFRKLSIAALAGGASVLFSFYAAGPSSPVMHVFRNIVLSAGALGVIAAVLAYPSSASVRCLEWPPIRYLGRISYGVYLYHLLLTPYAQRGAAWIETSAPALASRYTFFIVAVLATASLAVLSYEAIERPLLRLKRPAPHSIGSIRTRHHNPAGVTEIRLS